MLFVLVPHFIEQAFPLLLLLYDLPLRGVGGEKGIGITTKLEKKKTGTQIA